jgi:hypothetical protein
MIDRVAETGSRNTDRYRFRMIGSLRRSGTSLISQCWSTAPLSLEVT